jgi:REP element-mobilizing transposase RayT
MGKEKEAIAEIIQYLKYEIEELEIIKDKIKVPICEKIKDDFFFILNYLKKKYYYILNKNDI